MTPDELLEQTPRITDARTLRALAHPLRLDLLEAVTVHGPLTATQAAEIVGESPANCSWHLRQLAKHGLIESAPGADGRERPYQRTRPVTWSNTDPSSDPAFIAAADAAQSALLAREFEHLARAQSAPPWPGWETAGTVSTMITWLTADELAEVSRHIFETIAVHMDRLEDPTLRPPGSRPVRLMGIAFPDDSLEFDKTTGSTVLADDEMGETR